MKIDEKAYVDMFKSVVNNYINRISFYDQHYLKQYQASVI